MRWLVPLGLGSWLAAWNVGTVTEMDWWQAGDPDDGEMSQQNDPKMGNVSD